VKIHSAEVSVPSGCLQLKRGIFYQEEGKIPAPHPDDNGPVFNIRELSRDAAPNACANISGIIQAQLRK